MDNGDPRFPYPRFLRVPFIFVPHGAPPPLEWMAEHPGWVKFPATFIPHAQQPAIVPEFDAEPEWSEQWAEEQPTEWAEPEAPAAEAFDPPAPPAPYRYRMARAVPPRPWPGGISEAEADALFVAAAWAAHDTAPSPEESATREHRAKVHDAALAADVARRARLMGARPTQGRPTAVAIGSVAASGAGMLPEAAEGLEAVGAVTAGIDAGAAAMLLLPETANPGEKKALRQALAEHGGKPEAFWFEPPPPNPPLPGLVPPRPPKTKPGEGGFTSVVPGRHPEGFTPAPPPVPVHLGRPAVENKPTILESRKGRDKSGREGGLAEVLMPHGNLIGLVDRGAGPRIRTVTLAEFARIKGRLLAIAQPSDEPASYDGQRYRLPERYRLPDGTIFGIRESKSSGETLDILKSDIPGIPNGFKVHQK